MVNFVCYEITAVDIGFFGNGVYNFDFIYFGKILHKSRIYPVIGNQRVTLGVDGVNRYVSKITSEIPRRPVGQISRFVNGIDRGSRNYRFDGRGKQYVSAPVEQSVSDVGRVASQKITVFEERKFVIACFEHFFPVHFEKIKFPLVACDKRSVHVGFHHVVVAFLGDFVILLSAAYQNQHKRGYGKN